MKKDKKGIIRDLIYEGVCDLIPDYALFLTHLNELINKGYLQSLS